MASLLTDDDSLTGRSLLDPFGNARGRRSLLVAPDTMPTGEPLPGAGADAIAAWTQAAHNLTDWQPGEAGDTARAYLDSILMGSTAPGRPGFRAFHGSPHSFERFDTGKIGTGEGAQAFGHGLYFAEREGTARGYRDKLSMTPLDHLNGELTNFHPYSPNGPAPTVANIRDMLAAHPDPHLSEAAADPAVVRDIATMVQGHDLNSGTWDDAGAKAASRLDTRFGNKTSGSMYEVNINADPEHFLHWDKPLSEQHPKVQDGLADVLRYQNVPLKNNVGAETTGGQMMQYLEGRLGKEDAATELSSSGIPGIRYLDQGSRSAGEGTHNLVVFNPENIEILRKYGLAGLGLGTAAAAAGGQPSE